MPLLPRPGTWRATPRPGRVCGWSHKPADKFSLLPACGSGAPPASLAAAPGSFGSGHLLERHPLRNQPGRRQPSPRTGQAAPPRGFPHAMSGVPLPVCPRVYRDVVRGKTTLPPRSAPRQWTGNARMWPSRALPDDAPGRRAPDHGRTPAAPPRPGTPCLPVAPLDVISCRKFPALRPRVERLGRAGARALCPFPG